jgi:hypothetical protein
MISSVEFKKHISKTLSGKLKELGFKGTGFDYKLETENFVFVIGIQASRYGGQCCVEFGFQPKAIDNNGFQDIDFKKIKYYSCEFRTRLHYPTKGDKWWKYSEEEQINIGIANEIVELVKSNALPIITLMQKKPNPIDNLTIHDLDKIYTKVSEKLNGMVLMTSEGRLAWALTKYYEKSNPIKSKEFALYGLEKTKSVPGFFARPYLEQIVKGNNNA